MEMTSVVTGAWNAFSVKVMAFLPGLIGAVVIFLAGLIVAKILKMAIVNLLRLVRFDAASEVIGMLVGIHRTLGLKRSVKTLQRENREIREKLPAEKAGKTGVTEGLKASA